MKEFFCSLKSALFDIFVKPFYVAYLHSIGVFDDD